MNLHKSLQKIDIDLVRASEEAVVVIQCLENIRNNEKHFDLIYETAKKLATDVDVEESMPRRHRRNADAKDAKQYYYRNVFLLFLDHMTTELKQQLKLCVKH